MSNYFRNGNMITVGDELKTTVLPKIPGGIYILKCSESGQHYIETIDTFTLPPKLYGDTTRHTKRIITTFMDRGGATGVLLSGEKGSGKTLLAKNVAIEAAKLDIPTIVINDSYCGDAFNTFLQNIDQPTILLFDEFEKVYSKAEYQEAILTLMDGVFPTKKLFMLTCNNSFKINENMKNRPGRIYYMMNFEGLSPEFVREYGIDNLYNQDNLEDLVRIAGIFNEFNFDMLKAMVEEMNRYNETARQTIDLLNTKPEFETNRFYMIQLKSHYPDADVNSVIKKLPLSPCVNPIRIDYTSVVKTKKDNDGEEYKDYDNYVSQFRPNDIVSIQDGIYVLVNPDGDRLTLTPETKDKYRLVF